MAIGSEELRNRFLKHPDTRDSIQNEIMIRETYLAFAEWMDKFLPDGRAKSTTMTWLQQSEMWAIFAATAPEPLANTSGIRKKTT